MLPNPSPNPNPNPNQVNVNMEFRNVVFNAARDGKLRRLKDAVDVEGARVMPTLYLTGAGGEPYSRTMVSVDFDPSRYARQSSSAVPQDAMIEAFWQAKVVDNPRLYNASKFRLADARFDDLGQVILRVGLTDYRDLVGTHFSPFGDGLVEEGRQWFESGSGGDDVFDEFGLMGNAIGVGAEVVTTDNYLVLIERSNWTGESAGLVDRPGGHPEPEEALKEAGQQEYSALTSEDVLNEIFESPRKEVRDEIGIRLEDQEDSKLLGRILDLRNRGRVGLDFVIKVKLSKEEVYQAYKKGDQKEADETTGLIFIPVSDVETWNIPDALLSRFTCHCVGGLRLFQKYLLSQKQHA